MRKYKYKNKKSFTSIMVTSFMLVFVVTVSVSIYSQHKTLGELKEEEQRLITQIDTADDKNKQLQRKQDYYTSDAYIEMVAREQLGYVMNDEVVFKNTGK